MRTPLFLVLTFPTLALAQSNCPTVQFTGIPSASLLPSTTLHRFLVKQADGSYTGYDMSNTSPYATLRTIPHFDQQLNACAPTTSGVGGYVVTSVTPAPAGGYFVTQVTGRTPYIDYFDSSFHLIAEATPPPANQFADMNGDGKLDAIGTPFVNHNAAISIAINASGATFLTPHVYPTNFPSIQAIIAADVNNDHKLDIVVLGFGTIAVYLGNGDGTLRAPFTAAQEAGTGSSMALADLNGDGILDLIYPDEAGLKISLGRGDGTFGLPTVWTTQGASPAGLAVGDLNGDGIPDIFAGGAILFGDGKGGVASQSVIDIPPVGNTSTILTDFNSDGIVDIVFAEGNAQILAGDSVSVIYGLGKGAFAGRPFTLATTTFNNSDLTEATALGSADFNRDGFPDLVLAELNGAITVEIGKGDGTFQPSFAFQFSSGIPWAIVTADFNGDGKPDFAVLGSGYTADSTASITVALGNGDGTFQAPIITAAPLGAIALALGDFNGDGKPDLAVLTDQTATDVSQTKITETATIFLGQGDGTFKSGATYAAGPYASGIATGDFNGDGKLDLVVANNGTYQNKQTDASLMLYLGHGDGTFANPTPIPNIGTINREPSAVVAADFNRDGKLDLAVTMTSESGYLGGIMLMLGNGNGTFQTPSFYGIDDTFVAVADLNGDGIPDLIASGDTPSYFLGMGDGTFRSPVALPVIDGVVNGPPVVADFNHDGKLDIVSTPGNGIAVSLNVTPAAPSVVVTSAATLEPAPLAPASLATAFGKNFPASPAVTIEDISGVASPATILYSSSSQINFEVPPGVEAGLATLTISGTGTSNTAQIVLAPAEPTLFTLNSGGLAAAYVTRANPAGATYEPVFTEQNGVITPAPINVGTASGQAYLVLFGTGIRNAGLATVVIDHEYYTASYAGPQPGVPGLDQVNIALPSSLAGAGYTSLYVILGNLTSNPVYVLIE